MVHEGGRVQSLRFKVVNGIRFLGGCRAAYSDYPSAQDNVVRIDGRMRTLSAGHQALLLRRRLSVVDAVKARLRIFLSVAQRG